LVDRHPRPDAVVIEASGLADPMGIAQTVANVPGASLDGVVTLVDALAYSDRLVSAAAQALFDRQLEAAHLVMLTKTKTEGARAVGALQDSLGLRVPGRPVLILEDPQSLELVFGAATLGARPKPRVEQHSVSDFEVITLRPAQAVLEEKIVALLESMPMTVYRLKGILRLMNVDDAGETKAVPSWQSLQAVGRRWRLEPSEEPPEGAHLVVIGAASEDLVTPRPDNLLGYQEFIAALTGLAESP